MTGKFITFEGGEGSGKSTQVKLLCKAFADAGLMYVATREPGGSVGAEKIRSLLVTGEADAWDAMSETLLFYAARRDHVLRLIQPALREGTTVICDRFVDSTLVYQGIGKGVPQEHIGMLHGLTLGKFMPDLTIFLDIDPKLGLERAHGRAGDETRFEKLGTEFHEKIRAGFKEIVENDSSRCVMLDASLDVRTVHEHIVTIVNQRLGLELKPTTP